ncbi:hypothetical protein ACJX0J_005062, partial [Zea mays]
EFLLLSFFLSIEEYRLLEFGLSKKPWYRILIVNFYTELQSSFAWSRNRIPFFSFFKRIIEVTLNPLLLGFHNKSLDSELGTHVPSDESIFSFFYTSVSHSILFLNLSFGFLFFYLESAFKTKKKRKSFSIPNNFLVISCFWSHIIKEGKDYYSLDLGQDYSYARDRILRDMTKISPF